MKHIAAALIVGVFALPAHAADTQAMLQTATGFYAVYQSLHPSDGIPDAALRARFEPFISPALDRLFIDADMAEQRYIKATKNLSPPLVEGDLFSPNFEGATSLKIGTCVADAKGGHCPVEMLYEASKQETIKWTDTVELVNTPSGWKVDDIVYGVSAGHGGFGNTGRLTGTIRDAIQDGSSVPG